MMPSLTVGYQCNKTRQPSKDKGNFRSQHPCTMQVNDTHIRAKRFFFFFFSSRRRHTRFSRDWSSDVCCSDLRMPRMGGAELYARLQGTRPALAARVLFLSGDITELAQLSKVAPERALAKPVDLGELERRLLEFV